MKVEEAKEKLKEKYDEFYLAYKDFEWWKILYYKGNDEGFPDKHVKIAKETSRETENYLREINDETGVTTWKLGSMDTDLFMIRQANFKKVCDSKKKEEDK